MGLQSIPAYASVLSHPVELDRNVIRSSFSRSGAVRYGHFTIAPTGTTRQFSVGPGRAAILGQENNQQGAYIAWSDVSENLVLAAPSASPRIDTLLLRVYDSQYGTLPSGISRAQWDIIAGTPNASPAVTPDSAFVSAGAQYVPGAWWRVADIRTNPGDTTIPAGQIYPTNTFVRVPGGITLCTSVVSTTGFGGRPTDGVIGDRIYEIDTGYFYSWNGTKWIRDEAIVEVITDQSWTNNAVASDVTSGNTLPTGGLSFPVEANCQYDWEARILSTAASGVGLAASGSQPGSARSDAGISGVTNAGAFYNLSVQNATTATFGLGVQGNGLTVQRIGGRVSAAGTAGTFKLQFAQGVSNAAASWILVGSSLKHRQVG
jgi:hypothetical protein